MPSISESIIDDHREMDEYYEKILNASDNDTKTRYANLLTWELARHAIGEELIMYPAMEKHIPDGKKLADHDREEHANAKKLLYKFQELTPESPEFEPTLKHLMKDLKHHNNEEEENDLPALEKALGKEGSESLAKSFERTKLFVPSRAHPDAPDKPPYETVAALMAMPLDKIGDLFRKFPQ